MSSGNSKLSELPPTKNEQCQQEQLGPDGQPQSDVANNTLQPVLSDRDLREVCPASRAHGNDTENAQPLDDDTEDAPAASSSGPSTTFQWDERLLGIVFRVALILMESYYIATYSSSSSTTNEARPIRRNISPPFRFSRSTSRSDRSAFLAEVFPDDPIVPLPHLFYTPTQAPTSTMSLPSSSVSTTPPVLLLPPPPPILPTTGNPAPPSIIHNIPFAYIKYLLPSPRPSLAHIGVGFQPTLPSSREQPVRRARRASLEYERAMAERERARRRIQEEEERRRGEAEAERRRRGESTGILGALIDNVFCGRGKRKRDGEDDGQHQGEGKRRR